MAINFLSDDDVRKLKDLLARVDQTRVNPQLRPHVPESEYRTPEVYVAKTPTGGIPANAEGTGTGTGAADDPGQAECNVYQLNPSTLELENIGYPQTVYNLSTTVVAGNTFVLVLRDKFGVWWANTGGGGAGGGIAVVWVNEAGIPAMTEAETGTGSVDVDNPGSASCQIYARNPSINDLTPTGTFVTVHNANRTAVAGNRFITVGQDARGDWWVLGGVLDATLVTNVVTTCIAGVPNTTVFTSRIRLP